MTSPHWSATTTQLKQKLPDEWVEASTGLIRKNSGSNGASSCTDCDIVDWPSGERDGFVFRPYNTVINAIGYRSYMDMADIARRSARTRTPRPSPQRPTGFARR